MTLGADDYTAQGVTEQGLTVSCATNDTYCAMYNMECGQMYSINITANNHVCQGLSTSTETVSITTGGKNVLSPFEGTSMFAFGGFVAVLGFCFHIIRNSC